MTLSDSATVILPSWRQGRLLFFTSVTDKYTARLDYRVAAATMPGETKVTRTYKAPISNEALAHCQETADNGPALQQFFQTVGRGNLDDLTTGAADSLPPCAGNTNPLIYICSYFNFVRKYAVDQTLVRHYEARDPNTRFQIESTLAIYKTLSSHLQPERAAALAAADHDAIEAIAGATKLSANLLREVAVIQHDTGEHALAIETMQRAINIDETVDKWLLLADFATAGKWPDQTIDFFLKAEGLAPLVPPKALRLATLLLNAERGAEAQPFLDRAEAQFEKQVAQLRHKFTIS